MAQADQAQLEVLLATVRTEDKAIAAMLERVAGESAWQVAEQPEIVDPPAQIDNAAELQAKWGTAAERMCADDDTLRRTLLQQQRPHKYL
jgi:hypothetical protein